VTSEASARGLVREAGGPELLERLDHLDAVRRRPRAGDASPPRPLRPPESGAAIDFDVVIAGGGLWSLLAPVLAARGLRVAVVVRARACAAHREWNASDKELERLVDAGIVTGSELEALVVARYDHGVCRFHGGREHPVRGVLDRAVDAGALLAHTRALAVARGVSFFDEHALVAHASSKSAVSLLFRPAPREPFEGALREVSARVLVDARGASSPYATADLVCPTVGGVMAGLAEGDAPDEMNPRIGDILATVDGIEGGRQHVWEAFPGRRGETTVYLFFYATAAESISLSELYARFFSTLPSYKRGEARLVRPTFGFIPGWSRLSPSPRPPDGRVLLVGDAAARHSPLTYCGFGSALRLLAPTADEIARAVAERGTPVRSDAYDPPLHALTGALSHMMSSRALRGGEVNALLDAAFGTLREMGNGPYARLLQDEMDPRDFARFLRRTAQKHPAVWGQVARALGVKAAGRWGLTLVRSWAKSV
jgi:lycopene cyclase CruA